jgi:type II secretory pathway component GspD/PulD (secretin)
MRQFSRTHLAIGLLAAVVAVAGAAVQTDSGTEAKASVVRAILEQSGRAADDAVLLDAANRAHCLTAITFDDPTGKGVTLHTVGRPAFDYLMLEDGKKMVLDVYDTLCMLTEAKYVPQGKGPVREVRGSVFAVEPRFVTRLTLSLSRISDVRFQQEDGLIRLSFGSPQEAMTSAGSARKLEGQLEDRMRRVEIKAGGVREQVARWEARRNTLETRVDTEFASLASMLAEGKRGALTERLRRAVPSAEVPTCTTDAVTASEGALVDTDRAVATQKAELKASLAEIRKSVETAAADSATHAKAATDRLQYDLGALRTLEQRLSTKEGAKDAQALDIVHVLETKLERLQGEDLGYIDDCAARCDEAVREHGAALEAASNRLTAARAALQGILAVRKESPAPKAKEKDGSDVAVAAFSREVSRLRDGADLTAEAAPEARKDVSCAYIQTSSPTPVAADLHIAALTSELEAVQDAQLKLAIVPEKVSASLEDGGALDAIVLAKKAEDEPVAGDAPATEAAPAEGSAVPEEKADAPAPAAEPAKAPEAKPDAPAPAPAEAQPKTDTPPAEAPAPEPKAPPVKSEVIVTPISDASGAASGDITSLNEPVNLDLREMELSNFVALLARKAGINVIAGTELTGTVTASIRNVPLLRAMQMVLRMHDLGIVEEEGVYRIIPYDVAQSAERVTEMVTLKNGSVEDVKLTVDNILMNAPDGKLISVAANPSTNVLVISGPPKRVAELRSTVEALDVGKPVTPTVTEAIKLNYALPEEVVTIVQGMLTKETGKASVDLRGRHVVVTDVPAVIEQVRNLVESIDVPTKQVSIESMIVDAVLSDGAETGTEWLLSAVQHLNTRGQVVGSLQQGSVGTSLGNIGTNALDAGIVNFNVLTGDINLKAAIAAEASSRNAKILANPQIVIVENETGNISITDEYPYQEITQSTQGPPVSTTEFKSIGVTLDVTPRVTHENEIIAEIDAKQSSVSGLTDTGVPIEAKREAKTTLNVKDGQTIFIGGLRRHDDRLEVNKVPVLGDVPVLNFLFRNTKGEKVNTELMVFLTCRVMGEHLPELTLKQQENFGELEKTPEVPNAEKAVLRSFAKPGEMRDAPWKMNRNKKK